MNTTIVKLEPGIEEEPGSNKRKRETGSRDEPGVKKRRKECGEKYRFWLKKKKKKRQMSEVKQEPGIKMELKEETLAR
jgi:hypothetical protein